MISIIVPIYNSEKWLQKESSYSIYYNRDGFTIDGKKTNRL